MIHILTLKCGTKYDYRSVNILKRSIETYYNKPFTFYCMTDDPKGLDSDIVVLPMEEDFKYNFNTLSMVKSGFAGIPDGSDCVLMDIDIEVMSDPSIVFDHKLQPNTIGFIHKWWQYPYQKGSFICGMIYRYTAGELDCFYQRFVKDPEHYTTHYPKVNQQEYKLERPDVHVNGEQDYFLECAGIYNFNMHLFPSFIAENLQTEIEFGSVGTSPRLEKYLYYRSMPEKIEQPLVFYHYSGSVQEYVDKRYSYYDRAY